MQVGRFACLPEVTNTSRNLSAYPAKPGSYTARLTVGDVVQNQPFQIVVDPRLDGLVADPMAEYQELDRISAALFASAQEMEQGVMALRRVQEQVDFAMSVSSANDVLEGGQELGATLEGWVEQILQKHLKTGQNNYMYEARLLVKYKDLLGRIGGANVPVTAGVKEVAGDYQIDWSEIDTELQRILTEDIPAYNRVLRAAGLPEIYLPRPIA